MDNEYTIVIDSLRSVSLTDTPEGGVVLTVEDPHTVAIVEMSRDDLSSLYKEIKERLGHGTD